MRLEHALAVQPPLLQAKDSLGCVASGLHQDQELVGAGARFYRKRVESTGLSPVFTPASDRGYLVGISLNGGHRRRIFHGHHASSHEFEASAVYVRNFADDYRADLQGPFDFLLVEISREFFDSATDERDGRRVTGLECVTGMHDPVLANLARAMAPTLARPHEASTLFVDQMSVAIGTYLIEQYGGAATRPLRPNRRLSRQHEARAKEMLLGSLDDKLSVSDIAQACGLSRSYFIRAFHDTLGQTPHQWLMKQRVDRACGLLAQGAQSLADIAAGCGFADQSHFTRVFSQHLGCPPGTWRRLHG
jgi:AraC family transcriptional regulator